ncbi:hypothetical protein WN867_08685 [Tetragenococcus halophilus]|uniref:hypothetical protein n=1 Tax=Tetragenococcus halophilus TaxID=51669 RepID=UPI0030C9A50E
MDDSVLLNMIYEIYVETFPQKRKQSRQRKKRVKLSSEQLYHEFRSLKEFCRKIEKIEITLWALQELTQNLETSLNYKLEKRAKFIDNVSRIVIFFITGIAIVFAWTFLADELPYSERPGFLTIITNIIVIGGSIVLGFLSYFQDKAFEEEEDFLSILKDAQIIMKRNNKF